MKTLAVFALVCAMMALPRAAGVSQCSGGWSEINGRCFTFNPRPLTWVKAERYCHSLGGNLASVHSLIEYHEIQRLIQTATHRFGEAWIGGCDAHEVNNWFWTDGTPFSYSDWCDGEPNSPAKQQCLQMNFSGEKCWDNLGCKVKRSSVCAKKM